MRAAAAARRLTSSFSSSFSTSGYGLSWARHGHSAAVVQPASEAWSSPSSPSSSRSGPQWIFLGCPGVGKGTYASRLAKFLGIPHIAMGDLVRQELSQPTASGQKLKALMNEGKLLPDEVILELLAKRFESGSASGESGFILDGFPRTRSQAGTLDKVTDIDLVVNLRLREDVLIMKCLGRRICSGCGTNYNIANIDVGGDDGGPKIFMPPLLPPPSCAPKLTTRADDTEEVVRARLNVYADECKPVEDYYRAQDKLLDFDVIGGIPETWPKLLEAVRPYMPQESLSVAAA
eukprot:c10950_g1_i1 orf=341-1213(-)